MTTLVGVRPAWGLLARSGSAKAATRPVGVSRGGTSTVQRPTRPVRRTGGVHGRPRSCGHGPLGIALCGVVRAPGPVRCSSGGGLLMQATAPGTQRVINQVDAGKLVILGLTTA